jgi:hypothetical protein
METPRRARTIEFGQAEPLPDWERWNIEDITDRVTTPDGRVYLLSKGEEIILSKPEGALHPEAFVKANGEKIPFEKWAKERTPISNS